MRRTAMTRMNSSEEEREVSLLAIDQYMRHVRWTADLTLQEEEELVERIARGKAEQQKGCPDQVVVAEARGACDRLVEGYQRLVIYIARQYTYRFRCMELL